LIDVFRKLKYQSGELLNTSPFLAQDILFNAILCRADEDLRALAVELRQPTEEIDGWLQRMQLNFNSRFWHEEVGLYYDYDVRSGRQIAVNTASIFLPLFAGLASRQQAQRLVEEQLLDPEKYAPGGDVNHWVTTTAKSEATWEPRRYWRGPVWIILNWFIINGLERYGYGELAETIRRGTLGLIRTAGFWEYYDARDGSGCGSSEFSWSAALALELSHPTSEILKP
jgi:glycogen debranching enzyme